jgi:hypothetical protein
MHFPFCSTSRNSSVVRCVTLAGGRWRWSRWRGKAVTGEQILGTFYRKLQPETRMWLHLKRELAPSPQKKKREEIFKLPFHLTFLRERSRDSSVVQRWATGWMIGSSRPSRDWNFSLHQRVQDGPGTHPAYLMGTRGSFSMGKVPEVWSWPLTCT